MSTRARGLALAAAGVLLLVLPALARGLRWPPPQWETAPAVQRATGPDGYVVEAEGAIYTGREGDVLVFRAFVPEPVLTVRGGTGDSHCPMMVRLENLHPEASDGGWGSMEGGGTCRTYGYGIADEPLQRIAPKVPPRTRWRLVAVGDTGSGVDLDRFLARAVELHADFALHLGDLAYAPGSLEQAALTFRTAPLPVFTAIGNHDFHDGSLLLHREFVRAIGPRNSFFALGGVDLLNLDTAADIWPPSGGERGDLLARLARERFNPARTLLVMTHRPLVDPRPDAVEAGESHALGRQAEAAWMREQMKALGADLLLHGHIHTSLDSALDGIPVRIAGGGLGLNLDGSPDPEPKLLVIEWAAGAAPVLEARWEPLGAPR